MTFKQKTMPSFHNVRLPKETKARMKARKDVDWAEYIRQQIEELLDQLDQKPSK